MAACAEKVGSKSKRQATPGNEKEPRHGQVQELKNDKFCHSCSASSRKLLKCSACGIAAYCGRECQIAARPDHLSICKEIKKFRERLEIEKQDLMSVSGRSVFRDYMGYLWLHHEARSYCRAMQSLAELYVETGEGLNNALALEMGADLYLELLRLTHSDNQGVRDELVYVLLDLGRLQDAYDFVKWWATIDPRGDYDWGDAPRLKKGEWGYLRGQDMFEDLRAVENVKDLSKSLDLQHLIGLIVIKLLLVKGMEGHEGFRCPRLTRATTADDLARQKKLAVEYSLELDRVNVFVLPALKDEVKWAELQDDPFPLMFTYGTRDHAHTAVESLRYVWEAEKLTTVLVDAFAQQGSEQ